MKTLIALLFVGGLAAQTPPMIPMATGGGPVGGATNLTTVGSVPYVSASGTLDQDAGQFVWDATNNRLGIGTATPSTPLHVQTTTGYGLRLTGAGIYGGSDSNNGAGINLSYNAVGNRQFWIGDTATNFGVRLINSQMDGFDLGAGTSRAMTLQVNGNPLSIGTGATGYSLQVYGNSTLNTSGVFNAASSAGASYLMINNTGNVGIGTTTPSQSLEVSGGAIIASGYGNRAAATGPALEIGWTGTTTILQSLNRTTSIYVPAQYSALNHSFDTSGSARMTILGGGNVGIGTTTPAGVLDVFSGQTVSDELYFTNQDSAGNNQNSNSPRLNFVGLGATAGWGIQAVNTGAYSTKDLVFYGHTGADYTTYTERVRFTSGGNVGIGTPIPSAALTVAGDIIGTVFNSSATGATSAFQTSAGTFSITGAGNAAFQQVALALKAVAVTGTSGGTGVGNAMLSATTAGLFLSLNGAAPVALGAGAGTVTSVALTAPSQFTVTGTPITSSGTLAIAWNTQTANTVLAGPASGGAALPTYRALVAADISGLVTPGGSTTQVQYNNAGAFAGAANFAWANATNILTVGPANTAGTGYVGTLFNSSATGATSAFQTSTGTFSITGAGNAAFQGLTLTNRLSSSYYAPAGSNQQIQFNNSGAPGASASLTWNGVTLTSSAMSTSALLVTTSGIGVTGASSITSASAAQTLDVANTGGGNAIRATAGILVTAGGISVSTGGLSIAAGGFSVVGGILANGNTGFTGTLAAAISAGRNVQYGIIY